MGHTGGSRDETSPLRGFDAALAASDPSRERAGGMSGVKAVYRYVARLAMHIANVLVSVARAVGITAAVTVATIGGGLLLVFINYRMPHGWSFVWIFGIPVAYILVLAAFGTVGACFGEKNELSCGLVMCYLVCAAVAIPVLIGVWYPKQVLYDRGVMETAVVADYTEYDDSDSGTSYSYSLTAVDGPPIPHRISGSKPLEIGQRVTVFADPEGRIPPMLLATRPHPYRLFAAALALIGSVVACGGYAGTMNEIAVGEKRRVARTRRAT
jgi:hypothetical protein